MRPLVVCDDLDLPLGSVRLRPGGSSGGQNGLASMIEDLGGEEFPRLRLGIAPAGREIDPADWPDFVLADFAPEETGRGRRTGRPRGRRPWNSGWNTAWRPPISRFNRRIRPDARMRPAA